MEETGDYANTLNEYASWKTKKEASRITSRLSWRGGLNIQPLLNGEETRRNGVHAW